jgi:antitoxin MazE
VESEIKRWGNSAALRLPAKLLAAAGLAIDSPVDVRLEGGRLVIEPLRRPEYTLQELLGAASEEQFTLDGEDREWVDAPSVGREVEL